MVTVMGPVSFQHCTVAVSPEPAGLPACCSKLLSIVLIHGSLTASTGIWALQEWRRPGQERPKLSCTFASTVGR